MKVKPQLQKIADDFDANPRNRALAKVVGDVRAQVGEVKKAVEGAKSAVQDVKQQVQELKAGGKPTSVQGAKELATQAVAVGTTLRQSATAVREAVDATKQLGKTVAKDLPAAVRGATTEARAQGVGKTAREAAASALIHREQWLPQAAALKVALSESRKTDTATSAADYSAVAGRARSSGLGWDEAPVKAAGASADAALAVAEGLAKLNDQQNRHIAALSPGQRVLEIQRLVTQNQAELVLHLSGYANERLSSEPSRTGLNEAETKMLGLVNDTAVRAELAARLDVTAQRTLEAVEVLRAPTDDQQKFLEGLAPVAKQAYSQQLGLESSTRIQGLLTTYAELRRVKDPSLNSISPEEGKLLEAVRGDAHARALGTALLEPSQDAAQAAVDVLSRLSPAQHERIRSEPTEEAKRELTRELSEQNNAAVAQFIAFFRTES